MTDAERVLTLRYAGRCADCGGNMPAGERGYYRAEARIVRHLDCSGELDRGVAGASAQREFERRAALDESRRQRQAADSAARLEAVFGTGFFGRVAKILATDMTPPRARRSTRAWATGALGEERVGARLDQLAEVGVVTLHDRRIPGSRANIDHLVVTPWGVWVVDAKHYRNKKIDFDVKGGLFGIGGRKRLLVDRRDRTSLVDGVEWQLGRVREAVGDGIEVRGCLCFVESEWPLILAAFSIRGVEVCWPKRLAATLLRQEPPILDPDAVARRLASAFPRA